MTYFLRGPVWKRVWILEARSKNGCEKWHFLVWNRVKIFGDRAADPPPRTPKSTPGFKRQLNEPLSRFLLHFMFKFKLFNKCFFSQNGTTNSPPLCYFSSVVKKHSWQGRKSCLSIAPLTQEPEKTENHTLFSGTSPSTPPFDRGLKCNIKQKGKTYFDLKVLETEKYCFVDSVF